MVNVLTILNTSPSMKEEIYDLFGEIIFKNDDSIIVCCRTSVQSLLLASKADDDFIDAEIYDTSTEKVNENVFRFKSVRCKTLECELSIFEFKR